MNRSMALALFTAAALLAGLSDGAFARERKTTVTGEKGKTAERDVTRSKGDVTSTTTGPDGNSSSRSVDRSADGTTATVTGPKGKQRQRQTTRTDNGSTTTVTGPDGKTKTVTVEKQKQP